MSSFWSPACQNLSSPETFLLKLLQACRGQCHKKMSVQVFLLHSNLTTCALARRSRQTRFPHFQLSGPAECWCSFGEERELQISLITLSKLMCQMLTQELKSPSIGIETPFSTARVSVEFQNRLGCLPDLLTQYFGRNNSRLFPPPENPVGDFVQAR